MRNLEDIYPLSPMQQGMLFHSLYEPESHPYFEQSSWCIRGALDVPALREAWQRVVDRHPALRTAFMLEGTDEPLQVVYRSVEVPFAVLDRRDTGDAEAELARFLVADRERGFDLASAPLMRLTLIRFADDVAYLVWSHHHLLFDGWSQPLIFRDFYAWYEGLRRGTEVVLPPSLPYREYIAWLQRQDPHAAEAFWRETLAGFAGPTHLRVKDGAARATGTGSAPAAEASDADPVIRRKASLSPDLSAALEALAHTHHLTLNTIVQGAWGLLLSRYSGEDDVVFGATVSGRPAELPAAESLVGLCINTLPVRVRVDPVQPVRAWLADLQAQQARAPIRVCVAGEDPGLERRAAGSTPLRDPVGLRELPADRRRAPILGRAGDRGVAGFHAHELSPDAGGDARPAGGGGDRI